MEKELRKYIQSVLGENTDKFDSHKIIVNTVTNLVAGNITPTEAIHTLDDMTLTIFTSAGDFFEPSIQRQTREKMMKPNMNEDAEEIDEERLTNEEGKEFVKRKENFIASHLWGESLADGSYVAMSYGKQFPIYIFWNKKNKWYENSDKYIYNGEPQESTEEHKVDIRPTDETLKKSADWMRKLSSHLLKVNGMKDYEHVSVEPGTKN